MNEFTSSIGQPNVVSIGFFLVPKSCDSYDFNYINS